MRTKELIASIAVVGAVAAFAVLNINSIPETTSFLQTPPEETAFYHFMSKYGKSYGTKAEFAHRLAIFIKNYHKVMNHNSFGVEEHGFTMTVNQFSDMSESEFKMRLGYKKPSFHADGEVADLPVGGLPDSVNWLDKKLV